MKEPDKQSVSEMVGWLASFGKTERGGVTRLLYSEPWKQAQHALKMLMERSGFETYFDSVGNLFGRVEGSVHKSKTILTGSHIDTVTEGGKYDGAYGIIASFLAVQYLVRKYGRPKKSIEVVSLCEEEGSRFPLTFWGSGNITGIHSLEGVTGITDQKGIPFLKAMKQAGFPIEAYQAPIRKDIERFIELHIEQGIVLEKNKNTIGIVSHIVGQRRFLVKVIGECNHAGTTPMHLRRDAMSTAAELIALLTKTARKTDSDLVATVGQMTINPNVPNVIAGEVEFSLDIRHHHEKVLDSYCQEIFSLFNKKAKQEKVTVSISQWMDGKPVEMNPEMIKLAKEIVQEKGLRFQEMVSGAGHDAQVFGCFCPTILIFVPSKDGISHSPKEITRVEDLDAGVEVLSELLYKLAY